MAQSPSVSLTGFAVAAVLTPVFAGRTAPDAPAFVEVHNAGALNAVDMEIAFSTSGRVNSWARDAALSQGLSQIAPGETRLTPLPRHRPAWIRIRAAGATTIDVKVTGA